MQRTKFLSALVASLALGVIDSAVNSTPAQSEPLNGFYISSMLSHSSLQSTVRFPAQGGRAAAQFNDIGGNTIYPGFRAGYTHQFENRYLLGLEMTGRYALEPYPTTIMNALGYGYELSTKWEVGAHLRVGRMISESTAIYGTLGVTNSRLDIKVDGRDRSRQLTAPLIGFGGETRISDSMTIRFDWTADRSHLDDPLRITMVRWNAGIALSYWF